jgi:hypothetical protein
VILYQDFMSNIPSYLRPSRAPGPTFQGHFATPLKNIHFQPGMETGLLSIVQEVKGIGDQEGIGVGVHFRDSFYHSAVLDKFSDKIPLRTRHQYPLPLIKEGNRFFWTQDVNLFTDDAVLGANGQGLSMFDDWFSCQGQAYKCRGLGQPKQLAKHLGKPYRVTQSYLEGGNLFLGRKPNGEKILLIGEDSVWINANCLLKQSHSRVWNVLHFGWQMFLADILRKPQKQLVRESSKPYYDAALAQISRDLNVKPENIVVLPQPDFHLDLAIRPLQYPYVLVHDPQQSEAMAEAYAMSAVGQKEILQGNRMVNNLLNAEDYAPRYPESYSPKLYASSPPTALVGSTFEAVVQAEKGKYATCDEMCQKLAAAGFKPIRMGGVFPFPEIEDKTIEEPNPWLPANFLNAIVHERKTGNINQPELVYITNDSGLPYLNQLFEAELKEKAPWVKRVEFVGKAPKENTVSWMSTYLKLHGGIHCLSVEEPEFSS